MRTGDFTPGVLLPDSHYYRLSARDVAGNVWTHPAVNLKVEDGPEVVTLSFYCDRIQNSQLRRARPYAYFVFLDELAFPENRVRRSEWKAAVNSRHINPLIDGSKGKSAGMDIVYKRRKYEPGERYSEFVAMVPQGVDVPEFSRSPA